MKYNDKVRVKSGFYEGMEGTVIREHFSSEPQYETATSSTYNVNFVITRNYICKLQSGLDQIESDWINESDLELIK